MKEITFAMFNSQTRDFEILNDFEPDEKTIMRRYLGALPDYSDVTIGKTSFAMYSLWDDDAKELNAPLSAIVGNKENRIYGNLLFFIPPFKNSRFGSYRSMNSKQIELLKNSLFKFDNLQVMKIN